MKYALITLLASIGLAMPLMHAQADTLTTGYRTVNDTFNPPRFADARSYVFMEGVETKRLLKIGLFNPHNNANIPGAFALNFDVSAFNLDLEQKLSPAFSEYQPRAFLRNRPSPGLRGRLASPLRPPTPSGSTASPSPLTPVITWACGAVLPPGNKPTTYPAITWA